MDINTNRYKIYLTISKNIKRIRKEKGLTAKALAELCNLSYGYLRNLESAKVDATISIETLGVIANKLNVDITDLLKSL